MICMQTQGNCMLQSAKTHASVYTNMYTDLTVCNTCAHHIRDCRQWRAGVGDDSCLQANISNFVVYNRVLPLPLIASHFSFIPKIPTPRGAKEAATSDPLVDKLQQEAEEAKKNAVEEAAISTWRKERHAVQKAKVNALRHRCTVPFRIRMPSYCSTVLPSVSNLVDHVPHFNILFSHNICLDDFLQHVSPHSIICFPSSKCFSFFY
jgi:hypothetical protein